MIAREETGWLIAAGIAVILGVVLAPMLAVA
jgi:hypothetical protein